MAPRRCDILSRQELPAACQLSCVLPTLRMLVDISICSCAPCTACGRLAALTRAPGYRWCLLAMTWCCWRCRQPGNGSG